MRGDGGGGRGRRRRSRKWWGARRYNRVAMKPNKEHAGSYEKGRMDGGDEHGLRPMPSLTINPELGGGDGA